jgi:histone H3/H4
MLTKTGIKKILKDVCLKEKYETVQATRIRKDAIELVFNYAQDLDAGELALTALESAFRHGHQKTIMLEDVRAAILTKREPLTVKLGFMASYAEMGEA